MVAEATSNRFIWLCGTAPGQGMAGSPKGCGFLKWIQSHFLPPGVLVTVTMQFAMVCPADRHGELVTDFASQSS
jgi:hypothetical protein